MRRLFLRVEGNNLSSGSASDGGFNFYANTRLSFGAGAGFARGQIVLNDTNTYVRLSPRIDAAYWFTPRLRVLIEFQDLRTQQVGLIGSVATYEPHFLADLSWRLE